MNPMRLTSTAEYERERRRALAGRAQAPAPALDRGLAATGVALAVPKLTGPAFGLAKALLC